MRFGVNGMLGSMLGESAIIKVAREDRAGEENHPKYRNRNYGDINLKLHEMTDGKYKDNHKHSDEVYMYTTVLFLKSLITLNKQENLKRATKYMLAKVLLLWV